VSANTTTRVLLSGSFASVDELGHILRGLEYDVEIQRRTEDAIQAWSRGHCEVVLLVIAGDHSAPISAIKAFRGQRPHSPIMIVSSLTAVEDRVAALEAGADDYLTLPFATPELRARLSTILRSRAVRPGFEIRVGPLVMRAGDPRVLIGTERIHLTPSERALLEMFALASGNTLANSAIAQRLGEDGESISKTAVEVVICRLRRRLIPFGLNIATLRGIGYRLPLPSIDLRSAERPRLQQPPGAVSARELPEPDVPLTEESLETESQWWNTRLLEYTNDAIIIWEMQGRGILYWNRAAEQLYGYNRTAALGRTTHDLLKTQLVGGVTYLEDNLAKYGVWIGELTHTTADGRRVQVEGRLALMSQHNQRWLVLEVNRDITDRKTLESSHRMMERQLRELRALRGEPSVDHME